MKQQFTLPKKTRKLNKTPLKNKSNLPEDQSYSDFIKTGSVKKGGPRYIKAKDNPDEKQRLSCVGSVKKGVPATENPVEKKYLSERS